MNYFDIRMLAECAETGVSSYCGRRYSWSIFWPNKHIWAKWLPQEQQIPVPRGLRRQGTILHRGYYLTYDTENKTPQERAITKRKSLGSGDDYEL